MANSREKYQSNFQAALFGLTLDRAAPQPLHAQLTEALRRMILTGHHPGARLPASRELAGELSVSRMTVVTAYDQLVAEGYLVTRQGDGTYVSAHPPHLAPPAPRKSRPADRPEPWLPFQPGIPDQASFPHGIWARHLERAWRAPGAGLTGRPDPFGWYPLRAAIADHLSAWRGLDCAPGQIVITAGAWEAFDIIRGVALGPGDRIAIEDPGWPTLRALATRAGLGPVPVRIDKDGLNPALIPGGVSAAIVTPSRHYPTGAAMPLARRLALLHWAKAHEALIVEDDYDSEFRYQGQPLPALAGLDGLQRTLYMGSFSKLLSPSLRVGYLVLPEALLQPVRDHLSVTGARVSLLPQPALATFMESGEFAAHLRRMRRIYARRQARLLEDLGAASELLDLRPDPSGMHLAVPLGPGLPGRVSDRALSSLGAARGLTLRALSSHAILPAPPQGLLLGYAAFDEETLSRAARALVALLRSVRGEPSS